MGRGDDREGAHQLRLDDGARMQPPRLRRAVQRAGRQHRMAVPLGDELEDLWRRDGFAHAGRFTIAKSIAAICNDENADVLVGYDPSGGYGHPDHIQVHRTVRTATMLCTRPPRLFEATLPREPIARAVRIAAAAHLTPSGFNPEEFAEAWTPGSQITHRVNVRDYLKQKRQALQAHASQASADGSTRTLAVITRLPGPLTTLLLGTEYYVAVPHTAST